jgi:hypothetical protein
VILNPPIQGHGNMPVDNSDTNDAWKKAEFELGMDGA